MSHPGHSKLVEVWNPEQKSFYTACLLDIDEGTGMGVIQFIGSTDTQKIPLSTLRPCVSPVSDPLLQYSNNEPVEVRFELEGQGPSWWEGKIKGARVTTDPPSYLVTFDDAEYTNTYSTHNIRKASGIPRILLKKVVMPMPLKVVKHAEDSLAKLDSRSCLFCLRLFKDSMGRDFVNIIGHPDDVDHLCDAHNFKFQISQLERIADLNIQLAEARKHNPKHREVLIFEIPSSLVGLSLGKKGARVQELEQRNGIYRIQVGKEQANGRVKVSIEAKTVADAEACREAFELEEHRIDTGDIDFSLVSQELESLKTQSGILVAKIESKSHIICIGCRESLQTFHTLFGLEKIYLPDIVTRQKELNAVERPSAGSFRPGGFGSRGGMAHSGDSRGHAQASRGGATAYDSRPVIKPPKPQQQKQPQQQPQAQSQLQPQQQKQQPQPQPQQKQPQQPPQKQPQQPQQPPQQQPPSLKQQQQPKGSRKDRSPDPANIAITFSSTSAGSASVRTIKTLPEQQEQKSPKQQLHPSNPQQQQQVQSQQQHQQKEQQQQQPQHVAASPAPQEQRNIISLQDSEAQPSASVKAAAGEGKAQRPPKSKASSSSAAIPSTAPSKDAAPATASAISAPAHVVGEASAPVVAAAAAPVTDGQSAH